MSVPEPCVQPWLRYIPMIDTWARCCLRRVNHACLVAAQRAEAPPAEMTNVPSVPLYAHRWHVCAVGRAPVICRQLLGCHLCYLDASPPARQPARTGSHTDRNHDLDSEDDDEGSVDSPALTDQCQEQAA